MDFGTLKITDYELEYCVLKTVPPKVGKTHLILPTFIFAPGEIRTPDPLVRSQILYPAELRAQRRKHELASF